MVGRETIEKRENHAEVYETRLHHRNYWLLGSLHTHKTTRGSKMTYGAVRILTYALHMSWGCTMSSEDLYQIPLAYPSH